MESKTKYKQAEHIIRDMASRAFGSLEVVEITELSEGFFNVAYALTLSDGNTVILKIAPHPNSLIMTNEKNIMFSEVDSMRMVSKSVDVPVAEILYYDNSHELCDADYFFMNKLPGQSFHSLFGKLEEETIKKINFETGKYTARLNSITGNVFGYYGYKEKQGNNWFEVFKGMITDAIKDAERLNIDLLQPVSLIYELLDRDRGYLEEVTVPRFVHWDLWAGNIFIENDNISGLIDFERCMWADELMEVGFRAFCYNEEFYHGYGIEALSESQTIRKEWYDIYFALIVCLECDYRHYETREMYQWGTGMLADYLQKRKNS